jgi:hypothetical protein
MTEADNFYLQQDEPVKSCLLVVRPFKTATNQ